MTRIIQKTDSKTNTQIEVLFLSLMFKNHIII